MNKLSSELRPLVAGLHAEKAASIEAAIVSSPYLTDKLTQASRENRLDHIYIDKTNAHMGGYYDAAQRAIFVSHDAFATEKYQSRSQQLDVITGVLGHEVEHAFQKESAQQAMSDLGYQVAMKVRNPDNLGTADMTDIVDSYIKTARNHEADAGISGWNAVASRVSFEKGGNPKREEILERAKPTTACVLGEDKTLRLAQGIVLDSNFQLSDTRLPKAGPINREPFAACHFDQKPSETNLGKGGKSDYTNYYGAIAFELMHEELKGRSDAPNIAIDMQKLGLKPALLESNGLDFDGQSLSITDISPRKGGLVVLRDTGGDTKHSPKATVDEAYVSQASVMTLKPSSSKGDNEQAPELDATKPKQNPAPEATAPISPPISSRDRDDKDVVGLASGLQVGKDFREKGHPGNERYENMLYEVERMETAKGIANGPNTALIAAALTVKAEQHKIEPGIVRMEDDGMVSTLRLKHHQPEKKVSVDPNEVAAQGQSFEKSTEQWAAARSPHYALNIPAAERTQEQMNALSQLTPSDRGIFDKIRENVPPHINDDVVGKAMFDAKNGNFSKAEDIHRVQMTGELLVVQSHRGDSRSATDVSEPTPSMTQTVKQTESFNQQLAIDLQIQQELAQAKKLEQENQGPTMKITMNKPKGSGGGGDDGGGGSGGGEG
jgi:hypothetical protein